MTFLTTQWKEMLRQKIVNEFDRYSKGEYSSLKEQQCKVQSPRSEWVACSRNGREAKCDPRDWAAGDKVIERAGLGPGLTDLGRTLSCTLREEATEALSTGPVYLTFYRLLIEFFS